MAEEKQLVTLCRDQKMGEVKAGVQLALFFYLVKGLQYDVANVYVDQLTPGNSV